MNKFVQMVAILIATMFNLGFTTESYAQSAWIGAPTVTAVEYSTSDEAGNCQVLRNGQTSCRYYLSAKTDEIIALDGYATRPGLQLKRTGNTVVGYAPGTPGTVTMRKLMFCLGGKVSNNANLPEAERAGAVRCYTEGTVYSHVLTPEKVRQNGNSEVLVPNPTVDYFKQPIWAGYVEDQDSIGIAFVPPYKVSIAGKDFVFCPTGTREIRKWYNNGYGRSVAGQINDGNWRFTNSFAWRDGTLPKGYETSYDDELFCGPAQAEKLWVVNEAPEDGESGTGKFLSVFSLNPANWSTSVRTDIVVSGRSRSVTFDNSRNAAYMPRTSFRTFQAKSLGPAVNEVATVPDSRIAALVYERTGEVFHLATSTYGNRVFVYNPKTNQIWDFIPATGTVPNLDTGLLGDQTLQGAIFGDVFIRVIGITENSVANALTKTKVEVYDIPSRTQRATYTINKQLANSGQIFGLRPEVSLDPRTSTLWIASQYEGSLGYLDLNSGAYTNIPISQEPGIAVGATDVEVDSARNKLYVSIAKFRPSWLGASTPLVNGSLYEVDLATKNFTRQTNLQVYPWSVSILPTATSIFIAVTNSATVSGNFVTVPSTVSVVDSSTFAEVGRMQTQNQPTAIAVDFKD